MGTNKFTSHINWTEIGGRSLMSFHFLGYFVCVFCLVELELCLFVYSGEVGCICATFTNYAAM